MSISLMVSSSYIYKYGFVLSSVPYVFIALGLILAIVAYIVNDLVDYEIDLDR